MGSSDRGRRQYYSSGTWCQRVAHSPVHMMIDVVARDQCAGASSLHGTGTLSVLSMQPQDSGVSGLEVANLSLGVARVSSRSSLTTVGRVRHMRGTWSRSLLEAPKVQSLRHHSTPRSGALAGACPLPLANNYCTTNACGAAYLRPAYGYVCLSSSCTFGQEGSCFPRKGVASSTRSWAFRSSPPQSRENVSASKPTQG